MIFNKDYKRKSGLDQFFKRGTITKKNGLTVPKIAVATFDPSGDTTKRPIAAYGLGVYLPDNAIVIRAWYDVVTTFTSAGADAGTIALKVQGANDLVNAIAINAASPGVWDVGARGCLPLAPNLGADSAHDSQLEVIALMAALQIKLTAERELTATVAGQALTAGKLVLYVEYVISD
jgi:hypothetical protein